MWQFCYPSYSRPKKTQAVNHGITSESMGVFPYPSSDGTSSAVSTDLEIFYVMFKTCAGSFLNGFKNIPGKACVKRVHNNDAFVNVGNYHMRKTLNTAN